MDDSGWQDFLILDATTRWSWSLGLSTVAQILLSAALDYGRAAVRTSPVPIFGPRAFIDRDKK
jgi:hypothetical protein